MSGKEEARVIPEGLELQLDAEAVRPVVECGEGTSGVAEAVHAVHAGAAQPLGPVCRTNKRRID